MGSNKSSRITPKLPYLCMSCIFFPIVLALRKRSHRCSCFTVHSSGIFWSNIAPGTSPLSFTLSDLLLSITSTLLLFCSVTTLLSTLRSSLNSAMFVLTRVPPPPPRPNLPRQSHKPLPVTLVPGYRSFPKWGVTTELAHARWKSRRLLAVVSLSFLNFLISSA